MDDLTNVVILYAIECLKGQKSFIEKGDPVLSLTTGSKVERGSIANSESKKSDIFKLPVSFSFLF